MTNVFIGGSRKISKLNSEIQERINSIIAKRFQILVGDANGVDKAVQTYLHKKAYELVEVFCAGNTCRNNVGQWHLHEVNVSGKKDFDFYAAKDKVMADEASYGFMIWDGESVGTLMNVHRLVEKGKKVVVYVSPSRTFVDVKVKLDWEKLIRTCPDELRERIQNASSSEAFSKKSAAQIVLL